VRDVRALNEMPLEMGNLWLSSGAKTSDLPGPGWYAKYNEKLAPLVPHLNVPTCRVAVERLREIGVARELWGYYTTEMKRDLSKERVWTGGLKLDAAAVVPYLAALLDSRWFHRGKWGHYSASGIRAVLENISRPNGEAAEVVLPLDRFEAWLEYPEPMSLGDLEKKLRAATEEIAGPTPTEDVEVWADQLEKYGPTRIRESGLDTEKAYKLWQAMRTAETDKVAKAVIDQALDLVLEAEDKNDPAKVFSAMTASVTDDQDAAGAVAALGDKAALLEKVRQRLTYEAQVHAFFAAASGALKDMKRTDMLARMLEPMLARLDALPEPEAVLLCAMLTGKDALKLWATALGWKFGQGDAAEDEERGQRLAELEATIEDALEAT
jgi:hypothetical protein